MYEYTQERVIVHNERRSRHRNTDPVSLNLDIACQAKEWAEHMAVNDAWGHAPSSERPGQGENLAMSGTTGTPGELVPEIGWYDNEEIYYDYSTGDFISSAPSNA